MLRTLISIIVLSAVMAAQPPVRGTAMLVCAPNVGVRFDLSDSLHLLWLQGSGHPLEPNVPVQVVLLSCAANRCRIVDGQATLVLSRVSKTGYAGAYNLLPANGTKQEGTFVVVRRKQKLRHGMILCE